MINLSDALKAHRKAAGLTRQELAQRAGVSISAIVKIEKGGHNPTIATLESLFAAMGQRLNIREDRGI